MLKRIFLGLLISFSAAAAVSDPASPILVSKNTTAFRVTLNSNPTTGYSWQLKKYDGNLIRLTGHAYQPPNLKLIGAGGVEYFDFQVEYEKLQALGNTQLQFAYLRPWNQEVAKEVTFTVRPS